MEKGNASESQITYKELKNQRGIIRTGHTLITFEHYVIAIGNTQHFKGCIEYLDTRTNTLESADISSTVSFRYGHSACLFDYEKILIFGGKLNAGATPAEEDDGNVGGQEEPVQGGFGGFGARPAGWGARNERLEKTTVLSDILVVKIKEEADLLQFTLEDTWTTLNAPKKIGHSAHIYKNKMYVFGGSNTDITASSNDLWCFDIESKTWNQIKTTGLQPEGRSFHSSVLIDEKLYILGGLALMNGQMRTGFGGGGFGRGGFGRGGFGGGGRGGFGGGGAANNKELRGLYALDPVTLLYNNWEVPTNDLHYLNLESMAWERVIPKNFLPFSHSFLSVQEINGKLYLFGESVDLWIYDPVQNVLQKVSLEDALPELRTKYPSACVDNKVYLWGCELEASAAKILSVSIPKQSTVRSSNENKSYNSSSILAHMRRLFYDKTFSDITFEVEGQKIQAHRNILIKCRFFDNMFQSGMKESTASTIQITEISLTNFKAMLEFIYCNEVILSEKLALDLIVLADKYALPELKVDCETFLSKHLSAENILQVAKTAEIAVAGDLEKNVADYVIQHLDKLEESIDLQKLPPSIFIKAIRQQKSRHNQ